MITTSSNYLTAALRDDKAAEASSVEAAVGHDLPDPKRERLAAREQRIAVAVQRSRAEYKPEHAYTERRWIHQTASDVRNENGRPKVDRQRLEYLVASLYYSHPPEHAQALSLILDCLEPAKPLAGLSRELLDMGIRCALKANEPGKAAMLAEHTRSLWRTQAPGNAAVAADAFCAVGRDMDALEPLILSSALSGLHFPVLQRFGSILSVIARDNPSPDLEIFQHMIAAATIRRAPTFARPLYEEPPEDVIEGGDLYRVDLRTFTVDVADLRERLDLNDEGVNALACTIRRIQGAKVETEDEAKEKGVREL